ncbi:MAG: hypothetical protein WDN30_07215 [Pararobbsia sp.]
MGSSIDRFNSQQARLLPGFSENIAAIGGPQRKGARGKASVAAAELKSSFSMAQRESIWMYSDGLVSLPAFEGL